MTSSPAGQGWWLASDGQWYPPPAPVGARVAGAAEVAESTPLPTLADFRAGAVPVPAAVSPPAAQVPGPEGYGPSAAGPVAPSSGAPSYGASSYGASSYGAPPYGVPPVGPPPYGAPPPGAPYGWPPGVGPAPRTSALAVWSLVLVILLGGLGALAAIPMAFAARRRVRNSGGRLTGAGLALAALIVGFVWLALLLVAIAIPTFLGVTQAQGPGPSEAGLDASVTQQITGSGPNHFGATEVVAVQCTPPTRWTVGQVFPCTAYTATGAVAGHYRGTVQANGADGSYQWRGLWMPDLDPS